MTSSTAWKVLNSNLVIFSLGFVFVTIFGTWLADHYHSESWKHQAQAEIDRRAYEWERDKQFQLLQHRLNEGARSLDRIATAMNSRHFRLQRVFEQLNDEGQADEQSLSEYWTSVDLWNAKLNIFETELERLLGMKYRRELNAYESNNYSKIACPSEPRSIHAKFWCSNAALNRLRACGSCPQRAVIVSELASYIRAIDHQIDNFVLSAGNDFMRLAITLDEVRTEEP